MHITPIREPGEDDECFNARRDEHRDLTNFEDAAAKRLVSWNIQRHVRMHLDAEIEVSFSEKGAWVPVQVFVSFNDADVDPINWEE